MKVSALRWMAGVALVCTSLVVAAWLHWPEGSPGAKMPAPVRLSGRLDVTPAARAGLPPGSTVHVYAYAQDGPRVALAELRRPAAELPFDFTLDDTLAPNPAFRLSQAVQVVVAARVEGAPEVRAPGVAASAGAQDVRLLLGGAPISSPAEPAPSSVSSRHPSR